MSVIQNENELISRQELASRLKLHVNTISNYEKAGLIRPIRLGLGAIRYDYAEVINDLKAAKDPRRFTHR